MLIILAPLLVLLVAMLVFLLTSCTSGTPNTPTTTTPSPASTTTTPPYVAPPVTESPVYGPTPAGCSSETEGWTTAEDSAPEMSTDELYQVRVGQHDCFDRVVFDVNGAAEVGWTARYVDVVVTDGSGEPVPVDGGAALAVTIHAPELGVGDSGHQPGKVFATTGEVLYRLDWTSLTEVRYAGGFEGYSAFAVGVTEQLPFRVFSWLDTVNQVRHVVVDVAHP